MGNSAITSTAVALALLSGIAATTYAETNTPANNIEDIETSHNWSKGRIVKKANCTEAGILLYVCLDDNCEATKEESVAALGHDFYLEFITDTYPSCTEAGSKSKHCTRCEAHDETTEIPATGHKWDDGDTLQHANCISTGELEHHCRTTGCKATLKELIPATGHNWDEGVITTNASCTEKGIKKYTCLNPGCNGRKHESVREIGHRFNPEFTMDLEPTCEKSGKKSQHCIVCDERINITVVPATGHAWGEPVVKQEISCTQKEISVISCQHEHCGKQIIQEREALGHNFAAEYTTDFAATCAHEGSKSRHCTRCDAHAESITVPAIPHISGDTIIERMITPGCHSKGQYDEVTYCTVCKQETYRMTIEIPAKEHQWDEGRYVIYPTVSNKGKIVYTCTECRLTRHEIIDKLHEKITLSKNNKGEPLRVAKDGFCPGGKYFIGYAVASGSPIEYALTFNENAQEAGFSDRDWTSTPDDAKIAIEVPEACAAGIYLGTIIFRDEIGEESVPYQFSFKVNLPSSLTVAIFKDVVSLDNRGNHFKSYQWYHNGEMIEGANKPYFQEKGGLTGNYYVKVNIGTPQEMRTCVKEDWESAEVSLTEITVTPNPMEEEATLQLNHFEEGSHQFVIVNEAGTIMERGSFFGNQYTLKCSHYAPGRYIINVDGTSLKVIKK